MIGQNNAAEVLLGLLVVAVAIAFLVFAYLRHGSSSVSGYEVKAQLSKVDGLGIGTDVRISGIKVGTISDLTLNPTNFLVTVHMDINNDVKIPVDSSLAVTSSGLLGSQYIAIQPGGDDKVLPPGGMIDNAQGSIDLLGLISRYIGGGSSSSGPSSSPSSSPSPVPTPAPQPQSLPAGP
jgi:phospholipid/cholesterol/gamma-HCH transport system substrate-binding protein